VGAGELDYRCTEKQLNPKDQGHLLSGAVTYVKKTDRVRFGRGGGRGEEGRERKKSVVAGRVRQGGGGQGLENARTFASTEATLGGGGKTRGASQVGPRGEKKKSINWGKTSEIKRRKKDSFEKKIGGQKASGQP